MKKKILLVDDKSTIGKVAGVYLEKEYDFTYLEDPIKAIEWLNEGNVEDYILKPFNPLELKIRIKKIID